VFVGDQAEEDQADLRSLVWLGPELGVGEQRVEDSEVRMPERVILLGKVHQLPDEDVKQYPQVVRVKV